MRDSTYRMTFVSTPQSFLEQITIISTVFSETTKETAIAKIDALNGDYALLKAEKEDFETIQTHKTINDAFLFHNKEVNKFLEL